jgi:hypothetical protein
MPVVQGKSNEVYTIQMGKNTLMNADISIRANIDAIQCVFLYTLVVYSLAR